MVNSELIGYSGFVGQNLLVQNNFTHLFRSTDIQGIADGTEFDLVVCAGAPAVKWKANKDPENDKAVLTNLRHILEQVKLSETGKFVLISTIDVYAGSVGFSEDSDLTDQQNHAYGTHRLWLEKECQRFFGSRATIVRLPALFGTHLKKNYIFDALNGRGDMVSTALQQAVLVLVAVRMKKPA